MTDALTDAKTDPNSLKDFRSALRLAAIALAGSVVALSTPAAAKDRDIVFGAEGDGPLLERLIELDQADIDEMRADMAQTRADIADAIIDIEEARQEVGDIPGGRIILKIAFASARAATGAAVGEALADARSEIDRAEADLKLADVSDAERIETQGAIDGLREELDALEDSLAALTDALRA